MPSRHGGSTLTPSTWEAEARVLLGISGQPGLHNEFLDSLSYSVRPCLTKRKNKGKKKPHRTDKVTKITDFRQNVNKKKQHPKINPEREVRGMDVNALLTGLPWLPWPADLPSPHTPRVPPKAARLIDKSPPTIKGNPHQ